ncbi:DNA polymerase III subunit delta [Oenococcus sp.]|uniref:DNA polymerase III subunit delta n=1 Tax=Oenococcus sp. TaxID=1979414 RepID=UPI0039ED15DF
MTPNDFSTQLKKQGILPAVLLFSGQEVFLAQQSLKKVEQSIETNFRAWDFVRSDMRDQSVPVVLQDVSTMSFSGERRFVIMDQPVFLSSKGSLEKQDEKNFLNYLQNPESENTLIVNTVGIDIDKRKKIVKALLKSGEKVNFEPLPEREVFKIVKRHLSLAHVLMADDVINYYLRRLAFDLRLVMTNLDKLILFGVSGKAIGQEEIDQLVTAELNESAFDLVTEINRRHLDKALQLYVNLIDRGEAPIRINALLQSQYRLLIQAKALSINDTQLAQKLKIHPYRAKLANQAVSVQTMPQLSNAYLDLAKIDFRLKSTTLDPTMLFEMFLSNNV